ncbi:Hypothetical protein PHPALM_48 [Phytophthora palmivora]|uniref:Transposase n=1 Tax=Phytophthora palmivora TaxID=4796 RepID=A0A2P4YVR5_9STRA|nr:Hypothetical protein PHPALM_48 [Phytophthora palmivora]
MHSVALRAPRSALEQISGDMFVIGEDGLSVEIDEASLAQTLKYNRGQCYQKFWLFGDVDRTANRWFGCIVFGKRATETLLPVIKRYIKLQTNIMSDVFATYVCECGNKQHTLENSLAVEYTLYSQLGQSQPQQRGLHNRHPHEYH